MRDEFVKKVKSYKMFKELEPDKVVTDRYLNSKYPHLTFRVDDISDYMKIINLLSKTVKGDSFINGEIIYRGMAKDDWDFKPTLARIKNIDENLEFNLVNSFVNLAPVEFIGLNTSFELLSKMQHYGLPTRLLDFTENPLVALFFACSDENSTDKNARIVCHRAFVKIAQDDIIENVCSLYNNCYIEDMCVEDLEVSPYKYLLELYRVKSDRLMVARPAFWNKRIQNQQAVFMIFQNKIFDIYACWAYGGEENYPHIWEQERFRDSLEIVKNEPLEKIYPNAKERDFYINHNTITKLFEFYGDHKSTKLKNWEMPFKGRFGFEAELDTIDDYTLKNEFCSIIVDKKNKGKMLEQLKQLGIDKSFVYPEIQYVAEKVTNMYVKKTKKGYAVK